MRPILAALSLVLALGLASCSDDGDQAGAPSPTGSSSSAATTPSEDAPSDLPPARDACQVLDPADVGRVLGTTVERVVAGAGCRFANPGDPATASLGISQEELAKVGGLDGAKAGIGAVVEGEVEDLSGVGDGAFVVVGPTFGGSTPSGGGAVALGSSLVQITILPAPDVTEDEVRGMTLDALTLIAEKARG